VHAGVYAIPHTSELPLAAETAALLAAGADAVLSHHTAATLLRLRPGLARPVHITIPATRGCPALESVVVHRSRSLTPHDLRHHDHLPITSPARTLLDVAASLPDRDIERMVDEAIFSQRIVKRHEITALLERAGGHPGRARLARVVSGHARSTRTESPPEETLLRLIRTAELPEPILQATILGYRLDFFWPALRLAVEVDAYGTHGSATRFESDRRRDARLLAERGILVIRFTRRAIEEQPLPTIGLLARAIGRREAELRSWSA
jgi:very-short-patch-repair endonuclease